MHNVLVTGGAGFIGSNFVRHLLAAEPQVQVFNLDALTYAGSLENLKELPVPARHTFIEGNICDVDLVEGVFQRHNIDTVVHFAAESHVDRSIAGPGPFIQTNVLGTFTLLEAARRYWLETRPDNLAMARFHHVSTDEVYGSLGPGEPAFSEATPYSPNSPYAASKAASDHVVRAYGHTYGLPISISNCSNNYGPYQFPEKLIPLIILNALEGKSLPVYGDGQQIRDWLYVDDHCDAIHLILKRGRPGETYNIGGGNQPANLTIVETVCDMLDELRPASTSHHDLIRFVADRPGHDRRYAMDISKIRRDLEWSPQHTLAEGLRATVEWFLDHPQWAAAIRRQSGYQDWLDRNYLKRAKPA